MKPLRISLLISVLLLSVGWIIRAPNRSNYVDLPGGADDYVTMADNAINSPTGDFTWVLQVYHDNASSTIREAYITKEDALYDNFRWFKFHQAPFTRISFINSEPGSGNNNFNNQWISASFSPGNGAWFWIKLEFDADDGGGNQEAFQYWKQNEEDSWIDVSGTDGAKAGTGSDDFAVPLELGRVESTGETLDGRMRIARQYTGMGDTGTPDWEFNANRMKAGQTSYTDTYSGLTWNLNTSGSPTISIVEVP